MREFMSYVLQSFKDATGWNRDNVYSDLNETANGMYTPSIRRFYSGDSVLVRC